MYSLILLLVLSIGFSLALTPLARKACLRLGIVDRPDRVRKIHSTPVARGGGLPVALAYVGSFAVLLLLPFAGRILIVPQVPLFAKLLPAILLVLTVGILDDVRSLRPSQKLVVECVAAVWVYVSGVHITNIGPWWPGPWLGLAATVAWLVACTNAFNLIDGVDGLATGVGLLTTLTVFVASLLDGNMELAYATLPLAGALIGFLRYNFNPASIFLGDSGSLMIGFLLGCYAIIWTQKSVTLLGMTAPLVALALPLIEVGLSIVRRFLRRQPIFGADRDHIHHRLLDRGFSPRRVALVIYGVSGLAATFSLLLSVLHRQFAGVILVTFCGAAWIGIQALGYPEFSTATRLIRSGAFRQVLNTQLMLRKYERALGAAETAGQCWTVLAEACLAFGFNRALLVVAHHTFETELRPPAGHCWTMVIPVSEDCELAVAAEFGPADRYMSVIPFAEMVRRAIHPKLERWHAEEMTLDVPLRPRAAAV